MSTGSEILAESLKRYGIKHVFGVTGVPVIQLSMDIQSTGNIAYIGCRNEQAASYAAGAVGYLTGFCGGCLCVSGPGLVHSLAGLSNAKENGWPMILIGGSSDSNQSGMMAFQESPQVEMARPHVKYAEKVDSVERIPFHVERCIRIAVNGRCGPVYLDVSGDILNKKANEQRLVYPPVRTSLFTRSIADPQEIKKAVQVLLKSKRPLIIIGKGCQIGRAEVETLEFVEFTGIPFIPSPLGKGLVSDAHSQNVIAARSHVLKSADTIILLGSRLNWINHFGLAPRFAKDVQIIQVDIYPEAFGDNVPGAANLLGDAKLVIKQLTEALKVAKFKPFDGSEPWWSDLAKKVQSNVEVSKKLASDASVPMNYYHPLSLIQDVLRTKYPSAVIVAEGANTLDIGRTILENYLPRRRLDSATYGSMGPALGNAMAARLIYPQEKVVCVLGDSSFGFSGMEIETLCRYRMNVVIIIINNSGVAVGLPMDTSSKDLYERTMGVPPTSLLGGEAHYELMAEAFGGKGFYVTEPKQIKPALEEALQMDMPAIINIIINPLVGRKKQEFEWLTREKDGGDGEGVAKM
jgi:2-hydroxyacyl-CoA lyase 1